MSKRQKEKYRQRSVHQNQHRKQDILLLNAARLSCTTLRFCDKSIKSLKHTTLVYCTEK